ncbi:MAG: hypothetical protein GKR89_19155 [Candidatus Latescibacteria bacterium]|nr:hypothetical protein [Candidatus Latescibacterota bacterium]
MLWPLIFAAIIIVVVVLKYTRPFRPRCPECGVIRQDQQPLCPECGWIYEGSELDEDYAADDEPR